MKKVSLLVLFVCAVPLIFGSLFFNRNKKTLPEFNRNNPTDTKAANYQKYESVDADGDGFPDFTVQLSLLARTNVKVEIVGVHSGVISNMAYTISGDLDVAAFVPFQNTFYVYNDQIESLTFKLKLRFKNGKVAPAVLKPFTATNQHPVASFFISHLNWTNKDFVATNSADPDDMELYYAWDIVGFTNIPYSTNARVSYTFPSFGSNMVVLYVKDKFGYSNVYSNWCNRTNNPPVASFTITSANWTNKTFDATASYDPDNGAVLTYAWDTNADGNADTSFSAGNKVFPFFFTTLGSNDIVLFVSDGIATNRATNACLRTNAAPVALFTISNVNTTNKIFNASASSDPDGTITAYAWDLDGGGSPDTGFALANKIITNVYAGFGTNTVTLYVVDQFVTNTTSLMCYYTNTAPTAAFTVTPSNGSTNTVYAFNASNSTDAEGNITSYQWDFNGDGTYEVDVTSNTYATNFTNATNTYQIVLKVVDAGSFFSVKTNSVVVAGIDPGLLLHNKLDSAASVSNSIVGPNGVISGSVAFESAKYGNGVVRKSTTGHVKFSDSILTAVMDRGTYELWIVPKITQTVPYSYGEIGFMNGTYGWENDIVFSWADSAGNCGLTAYFCYKGTTNNTHSLEVKEIAQFVATIGQAYHLALVWDRAGIAGSSDTVRILRDGVVVASTASAWASVGRSFPGTNISVGGWGPDSANYDKIKVDNIKFYNYAKTNFSDRFTE